MRKLMCIPIIHTEADLGSLADGVAQTYRARYGAEKWKAHLRALQRIWEDIEQRIQALALDFERVRIYQDGLPVCGEEEKIVRELASRGSANHQLVARLMDRGAKLVGTEDPRLLLQEYNLLKEQLAAVNDKSRHRAEEYEARSRAVLEERDRFIARRIEQTLAPGETGILFMGLLHQVQRHLSRGIEVQFPMPFSPSTSSGPTTS
jgi:hypothetical protein